MERVSVMVRGAVVLVLGASTAKPEPAPPPPAEQPTPVPHLAAAHTVESDHDVWAGAWGVALRTSMR
jgi:hypothetical protein